MRIAKLIPALCLYNYVLSKNGRAGKVVAARTFTTYERNAEIQIILYRLNLETPCSNNLIGNTQHRPTSAMGSAISYALSQWPLLLKYVEDGRVEIDNNLVENAIRPTAIGKKNWMFIGHPDAGQRAAILYTILENCKRQGINPREYLLDVLGRMPGLKNNLTEDLTPARWAAARRKIAA